MKVLKYLFRRSFQSRWLANLLTLILVVAAMVLVFVFHEDRGSEDYLICKVAPHAVGMMFAFINFIVLIADVTGNRLMRSAPISPSLRTFGIPMYCTIIGGGIAFVINVAYTVFCLASGLDVLHISDMLVFSAAVTALVIISGTLCLNIAYGSLVMIYAWMPIGLLGFIVPDNVWKNGFGLPLWAGVLIFVGAVVVSAVISFAVSHVIYKKVDFKPLPQTNLSQR